MKPLVLKKSLSLTTEYEPGQTSVIADESKIVQAMDNLLMNGIKFTPERGRIHVSVMESCEADTSAAKAEVTIPSVIVCVKDNGVGIPAKDIPYMFDKIQTAGDIDGCGRERDRPGLGNMQEYCRSTRWQNLDRE